MNLFGNNIAVLGAGGGDNAMAALGLGQGVGDFTVSIGTSGVVSTIYPKKFVDSSGAFNGFADATGKYLPIGVTLNAARIIDTICQALDIDFARLDELALAAPDGSEGLTVLPYFEGERVPNRPSANGTLFGITNSNLTPSNLARAFIEGTLLSLNNCLTQAQAFNMPLNRIFLIGGSAQSRAVQAIAPKIFTNEIILPPTAEYVALGAAKQAAWVLAQTPEPPNWPIQFDKVLPAQPPSVALSRYNQIRDLPTLGELSASH
jgi:xylulokinase